MMRVFYCESKQAGEYYMVCTVADSVRVLRNKSRQGTVKGSVFYRIFCCRLAVVSWRQDLTEI